MSEKPTRMSEEQSCDKKLTRVLQLFLDKNYYIASTTYLDLLTTHILQEIKKDGSNMPDIIENWIATAVSVWNQNNKPCQSIITFTIKLIGNLSTNEAFFLHYHKQHDVFNKFYLLFEFDKADISASIKMAFTQMFLNLTEHHSGRQWMIQAGIWKSILRFAQQNHTIYLTRDSRIFLCALLLKECSNENLCKEIINIIVQPMIKLTDMEPINDQVLERVISDQNKLLINSVELVISILEKAVFQDLENPIPSYFESVEPLESRIKAYFHACLCTPYGKTFQKLSMLLSFIKLRANIRHNNQIDKVVYERFCFGLVYNAGLLLPKKLILNMVLDPKVALMYFYKLSNLKKFEIPRPQKFSNQAITLMMIPLLSLTKPFYAKDHYFFEEFMDKIFNVTSVSLQRLAYNIRNVILQNPDLPLEHICAATIEHMLEILDFMDRDTIIIMFQTTCHVLKNFVPSCKKDDGHATGRREPFHKSVLEGDPITEKPILLASLLNALIKITERFQLQWRECVETVCIMSICQGVLNHTGVDPKICTLALKLCKLAIENFMQPNLALLVDLGPHSKELGPMLFKRLHDVNWEVQDSALEVLNTMAIVSEEKYIFYQEFIIDNKFLEVALDMVQNNGETYIRASALVFLATAVRIDVLWDKYLFNVNLTEIVLPIIQDEDEAIVRREAVNFIKELFIRRNLPSSLVKELVYTMTKATILDLHWEIKVNALEFWRQFIHFHFSAEGMVNGVFPDVTFSKKRRVVELTETEIINRLNNALDELAEQGCLGALLHALNDEDDFEVAKTAVDIMKDLRKTLMKYKVTEPTNKNQHEVMDEDDSPVIEQLKDNYSNESSTAKSREEVIEDIIASNDSNILASLCKEKMDLDNGHSNGVREKNNFAYLAKVTRTEFLYTVFNFDFDTYIKVRKIWLETHTCSYESTLDDILTVYSNKEINSMDCY